MKIGIYYGSTTGNTQAVAELLVDDFVARGHDVLSRDIAGASAEELTGYDLLILGSSTWGLGELQDDWESFMPKMAGIDLSGKAVALYGVGDQQNWADTFVDAVGIIYFEVVKAGADVVGFMPLDGYQYSESKAVVGGKFVGMPFDQNNQSELTQERAAGWVGELLR